MIKMRFLVKSLILVMVLLIHSIAWAAHPLITDDSGTQGKGKFQIEVNGQYDHEKETDAGVSVKETATEIGAILSYGILDHVDIVIGLPYQRIKAKEDGAVVVNEKGMSDATFELKWRFYEKKGLSFALKPGLTIPTGDEEKGLGTGKTGYSAHFIATKEAAPWAFHLNLGYIRNENKIAERNDLWHASFAAELEVVKDLKLAANIGIESNPDKTADTDPAFLLGGVIYSITEDFDMDFGVKAGLNEAETDYSLLAGIAFRF